MNQNQPILAALDASDPELAERLVSRRAAIGRGAALATAMRVLSVPVALSAFARTAFAQGRLPAVVIDVLNFALVLEYLESEFYNRGVAAPGLIPAADRAIFTTIQGHESAHVQFLVTTLGRSARPKPTFDFTAGGAYADVFTNYATFKAVSQAFEDTGVRAFKGQAPDLMPYKDVLTAALTIHSVEARHAAEIRRLRGDFQDMEPYYEGWITGNMTDVPGAAATYAGEENTTHLGIDATTVSGGSGIVIASKEVSEAFDEPLTQTQVLAIVKPFIVG